MRSNLLPDNESASGHELPTLLVQAHAEVAGRAGHQDRLPFTGTGAAGLAHSVPSHTLIRLAEPTVTQRLGLPQDSEVIGVG